MKKVLLFAMIFACYHVVAQHTVTVSMLENEYWWGGVVAYGSRMPYIQPIEEFDLARQNNNNQVVPLLLSNKGRYMWSDYPFKFSVSGKEIFIHSDYEDIAVQTAGSTLRDAYREASQKHFPPSGQLPDTLFFTRPQYNTWIELMYNQNQEDVLKYAQGIVDNGFPAGILMIDDNWQKYYGNFEFKPDKFPDPKAMVDKLHSMGFKVMLWVCPFVSADSPEYRMLRSKGYLLESKNGKPAIIDCSPYGICVSRGRFCRMQRSIYVGRSLFDCSNCYKRKYPYRQTSKRKMERRYG